LIQPKTLYIMKRILQTKATKFIWCIDCPLIAWESLIYSSQ